MLKDKLLCNLEGKIDLTSEQESPQTGFCWHRKCWQVNQFQIYSEGFIIPAFWNCNTYQVFRNTTWLVNLPIKPTLRLNKIVYTHTHTQCIGQIAAQQVGMNSVDWKVPPIQLITRTFLNNIPSLKVIEFALATKMRCSLITPPSCHQWT